MGKLKKLQEQYLKGELTKAQYALTLAGGKLRLTVSGLVKHPRHISCTPFHTVIEAVGGWLRFRKQRRRISFRGEVRR